MPNMAAMGTGVGGGKCWAGRQTVLCQGLEQAASPRAVRRPHGGVGGGHKGANEGQKKPNQQVEAKTLGQAGARLGFSRAGVGAARHGGYCSDGVRGGWGSVLGGFLLARGWGGGQQGVSPTPFPNTPCKCCCHGNGAERWLPPVAMAPGLPPAVLREPPPASPARGWDETPKPAPGGGGVGGGWRSPPVPVWGHGWSAAPSP